MRIEYCNQPLIGNTNPAASTQKLDCYAAEQIETAPYTTTRLYLPDAVTSSRSYLVQYARRFVFAASGQQSSSLRLNRRVYGGASLDLLVSNAGATSGNLALCLDIGNDGVCDYNHSGSANFPAKLEATTLAEALNNYLLGRNDIAWGDPVDVPVRLTLDRAADVMLTNLALTPLGAKTRFVRLEARTYQTATLGLEFRQPGVSSGPLAFTVDVGADGTVDWSYAGTPNFPARLTSDVNLADAFNAYLSGRSGQVDIPIRITPSPLLNLSLVDMDATPTDQPDLAVSGADLGVTAARASTSIITEGDVVPLSATVHNNGAADSGPFAVTFFADSGGRSFYIGSAFVPTIQATGTGSTAIDWNTLGFTGPVTVTAVVDPFNRTVESDETNNRAMTNLTILTRPDLRVTEMALSNAEPMAGETVTVTVQVANGGQTAAPSQRVALYRGNPDGGGASIQVKTLTSLPANNNRPLTFVWTPATPGPYRLFVRSDRDGQVAESDEANNDRWQDVYVGFTSPLAINSGGATGDPAYAGSGGFGAVDVGTPDEMGNCGTAAYQTFRRDPGGAVVYRFDHLLPGHYYHLDLTLYECGQNAGRQQVVSVDGIPVAGPEDLGDGEIHRLSLLLDPALYADRSISVTVSVNGTGGALVNEIGLVDVDYRYADAGGSADPGYPTGRRAYGWLDGVSQKPWGTLPYQSLREDQTDNEVRYGFDQLDPAKQYQLHLNFYQATGNNRVQQIWVDDRPVGSDVTIVAGQPLATTVTVPTDTYADGKIVVGIRRSDGATTGAMINEIALEELTQERAVSCQVTSTPFWSSAYGSVTVAGQPAPIGAIVTAENPRGDVVGCFTVDTVGQYGYMTLYGEDASANPAIPGLREGEPVIFRVNGALTVSTPLLTWTDDKAPNPVDLAAGVTTGQFILVKPNWNLISARVEPPVPLVDITLQSIRNKYCLVLAEQGIYDCNVPANFRSLKEVNGGRGYYLRIEGGASANLLMEGVPIPADRPIALHPGLNWVGYLPSASMPITTALQSIDGRYVRVADGAGRLYDPANPGFSQLKQMDPGQGYLIYASQAVTLTYPTATSLSSFPEAALEKVDGCSDTIPTPFFAALYGSVTVGGQPAPVGTRIEAVTPRGEVAGCAIVSQLGEYGFMPIFGNDHGSPAIPGFFEDEPIQLRINGIGAVPSDGMTWADDKTPHLGNLEGGSLWSTYLPYVAK